MTKPFELIYSRQSTDFVPGRAYANPRFYSTPRQGVTKVIVVGDWPKIVADYQALDVEVEVIEDGSASVTASSGPPASLVPTIADPAERAKVYIPDDWASLPWSKPTDAGLTLRGLAAVFADTPVRNKADATLAIEAELTRRSASEDGAAAEAAGGVGEQIEPAKAEGESDTSPPEEAVP